MSAFDSECSSGCESGWTLYLEHSYENTRFIGGTEGYYGNQHKDKRVTNEYSEGVEDLSMVSDASSGPPHHDSYFNAQDCSASKPTKLVAKRSKKRQKVQENNIQQHLDDTASSPLFDNNNVVTMSNQQTTSTTESMLDYSQGFSATYFEVHIYKCAMVLSFKFTLKVTLIDYKSFVLLQERSSLQDHFSFLQPSLSQNEAHINK